MKKPATRPPANAPATMRADVARALAAVVNENRTIDWILTNRADRIDTAQAVDLLFGVLRHYFSLAQSIERELRRPMRRQDFDVFALMLVSAYQIAHTDVPRYAAISEAVNACTALHKPWGKPLVNRVMRAFRVPKRSFDHPEWLIAVMRIQYPNAAEILFANNTRAPMCLRVNRARMSESSYGQALASAEIDYEHGPLPGCIVLDTPRPSRLLPGWEEGWISVQDGGAQLVSATAWELLRPLLARNPRARILDACAAPGGKLAHLLECLQTERTSPGCEVLGIDLSEPRLDQTREILQRLGHYPDNELLRLQVADAGATNWWDGRPFDFILLDAPCSGTGTIRRHPDIKLLLQPEAIPVHAAQQLKMLNNLWQTLAPGGTLLYCTCSLLQEENDNVVEHFMSLAELEVLPLKAPTGVATRYGWQTLPTDPHTDGFFFAALRKAPGSGS